MTGMDTPKSLDEFRTLPPATWRGLSTQDLGSHVQHYRSALIADALKTLPLSQRNTPGKGPQYQQKTRITMAAFSRINADTKTYPPLGKDSLAVTKALSTHDSIAPEDKSLCGKLAMLCDVRAKQKKQTQQKDNMNV